MEIGGGCNYLESNNESEIETEEHEEEVNPEEDIRKRIEEVVDTVQEFSSGYEKTRKTIKEQLGDIITLGINKYGMKREHVRDLIDRAFEERRVDLRYLRKLLPDMLKDTSKTPLSHKHRQQLRQQLKQHQEQQTFHPQKQEIPPEVANINVVSTEVGAEALPLSDMQITETDDSYNMAQESDTRALEEELRMAHAEIKRLQKTFPANAFLKFRGKLIPIVATIDPSRKVIISVKAKWY